MFNILKRKPKLSDEERMAIEEKRIEEIFLATPHGKYWQAKIEEFGEDGQTVYTNHLVTFKIAFLTGAAEAVSETLKNSTFKKIDAALLVVMVIANVFNTVTISDQAEIIENLNKEIKTLKEEKIK